MRQLYFQTLPFFLSSFIHTYKLWGAKNIFELIPCFDFVSNAEVNELDPRAWYILVKQHDVFRLERRKKRKALIFVFSICSAASSWESLTGSFSRPAVITLFCN